MEHLNFELTSSNKPIGSNKTIINFNKRYM